MVSLVVPRIGMGCRMKVVVLSISASRCYVRVLVIMSVLDAARLHGHQTAFMSWSPAHSTCSITPSIVNSWSIVTRMSL